LKSAYLEMEGWIEEKMGGVKGDFQGGAIDVMTVQDVEVLEAKVKDVQKEWKGVGSIKRTGEEVK